MDDVSAVRRLQPLGDLDREVDGFIDGERPTMQTLSQVFTVD
jgi:hypothetical protein